VPTPHTSESFDLDEVLRSLARTPEALRELLDDLPPAGAVAAPDGQWSAFDVVGHLIDGEETDWIPRARLILSKGPDLRFEPFDRHRHLERNRGKSLEELVDEFCWLREANLDTVRSWRLSPGQLALTGEHPELGTVTLRQLMATWAVHDLGHLAQLARALASRWADDVGPWRAYLPVLGASRGG
jgi:DinB superfamily